MTVTNETTRSANLACCNCGDVFEFGENQIENIVENSVQIVCDINFENNFYLTDNFQFWCEQCFIYCDDCREPEIYDNTHNGRCLNCDENYFSCFYCYESHHDDYGFYIENICEIACRECVDNDENFARSSSDGSIYTTDSAHWDDFENQQYPVFGNRPNVEMRNELIQNYSFKPKPKFFKLENENTETFFGVELEIELANSSSGLKTGAQMVKNSFGDFVYMKYDGSLQNGFEIVSHPFSFEWYKANFKSDILRELAQMGFRSWDSNTCGTHVHISRKAFKDSAHVWRFVQLFLKNKNEWVKLAGRNSKRWSSFEKDKLPILEILKKKTNPERYCAVNLCNYDTIEIRIFRGSLNETRFRSAIELVAGAVEYSRMITIRDYARNSIDFTNFAKFLNLYSDEYPNANQMLIKKGLI